jgi:hypothetical protein
LFRSGLAGYEGVQEGPGVLAEYLVGGITIGRLRLIAARVVACAAMLEGACFAETFHSLVREHGFTAVGAFNLTLRLYRGGGLAKDAIYLRGLLQVLDHVKGGGALDPFFMGKVTDKMLAIAETVRPKLIQDGMFLVGLDIVGDKILEINVFTPGGMWSMNEMYKTDFLESVIMALEKKLEIRRTYAASLSNRELATL